MLPKRVEKIRIWFIFSRFLRQADDCIYWSCLLESVTALPQYVFYPFMDQLHCKNQEEQQRCTAREPFKFKYRNIGVLSMIDP